MHRACAGQASQASSENQANHWAVREKVQGNVPLRMPSADRRYPSRLCRVFCSHPRTRELVIMTSNNI